MYAVVFVSFFQMTSVKGDLVAGEDIFVVDNDPDTAAGVIEMMQKIEERNKGYLPVSEDSLLNSEIYSLNNWKILKDDPQEFLKMESINNVEQSEALIADY